MKKFFRALALVLALALVIGAVPAKTANAGVKKNKTLYIDKAQGKSTDGTKVSGIKERVAIYKLAGYKKANKEGHTFKAVATSGADYVTISKNYVYASALGTAVLEIFVDGESIGNSVVKVKKNADKDTLTITELAEGAEVVCGKEYTVTLPRAGKDSDERRLFVDGEPQTEDAELKRVYKVTFTTAGEHKVKFEAFQSEELDAATAENEITVKAVMPELVSAKQLTANSFAATFSSSVKGLIDPSKITNQDVYYLVADKPVVTGLVKSAEVDPEDPTRVVVTFFADFKSAETYYFKFGESDPVSFTTAQNGSKYVDTIKISLATTYIGEGNAITVKYFNKDGVEINPTGTDAPAFESSNNAVAYIDTATSKVFFCSEDTVTIKATFFTGDYDPDTYVPVTAEDSITVTGTNKTAASVASTKYSFDGDASHEVHTIRLGGANGVFKVDYTLTDDTHYGTAAGQIVIAAGETGEWKLQSTDETIAMITGANGDQVVANKQGQTTIVLYNKDTKGNWNVYDAFALTVGEKNHNVSASVSVSKNTYNMNGTAITNGETAPVLSIDVVDLDGEENNAPYKITIKQVDYNAQACKVSMLSAGLPVADYEWDAENNGTYNLTLNNAVFDPSALTAETNGRVSFNVTVKDKVTGATIYNGAHTVAVGLYDPAGTDFSYVLSVDRTELDVSIKKYTGSAAGTAQKTATFKLTKVINTGNGQFFLNTDAWDDVPANGVIPNTAATNGATDAVKKYLVISFPDNFAGTAASDPQYGAVTGDYAAGGNTIAITNFQGAAGKRAVAGTYTVTAYKAVYDKDAGNRKGLTTIGSVSVLVKKNDIAPTVTIKSDGGQGKAAFLKANLFNTKNVFKLTWDGTTSDDTPTALVSVGALSAADNDIAHLIGDAYITYDNSTDSFFVKKLDYTVLVDGRAFTGTVAVGTLFKD